MNRKRTTEEKLLDETNMAVRFLSGVIRGKIPKPNATRVAVARLVIALQLDKDKREGKSSSSYESILMNKRKEKNKKED